MGERLVICELGRLTGFKEETEMVDKGVSCKEFIIKGRVLGFSRGQLLGEELEGRPGSMDALLQYSTNMGIRGVDCQGQSCTRDRVSENWNGG